MALKFAIYKGILVWLAQGDLLMPASSTARKKSSTEWHAARNRKIVEFFLDKPGMKMHMKKTAFGIEGACV